MLSHLSHWLYQHGGKRAWDLAGAAVSLALAALPLGVCLVLIRRDSRGPGLIAQWRVGRDGRLFRCWKLRTMTCDAEADGVARMAARRDPRVTRVGEWLRAWHGDELPQLWNVLRGDMALVGPRPERPEFVTMFRDAVPGYDRRHRVRPGLTGWAQVTLGYADSLAATRAKTVLDLYYLDHAGWSLDWTIWWRTWAVSRHGSRRRKWMAARALPAGQAAQAARAAHAGGAQ